VQKLLPAASLAVECDQTDRFLNIPSPLPLILGDNSVGFKCNPSPSSKLLHGGNTLLPAPNSTSNSECNSNSNSNSALIESREFVQHRQCVATCMRNVPSNLTNRDFDRHLSAESQDVTHTPSTRSCHPPQCYNVPTCNVHPNVGDLP
jgi:hypothetical protein